VANLNFFKIVVVVFIWRVEVIEGRD